MLNCERELIMPNQSNLLFMRQLTQLSTTIIYKPNFEFLKLNLIEVMYTLVVSKVKRTLSIYNV